MLQWLNLITIQKYDTYPEYGPLLNIITNVIKNDILMWKFIFKLSYNGQGDNESLITTKK